MFTTEVVTSTPVHNGEDRRGWTVIWHADHEVIGMAVKSPLTGAWLVTDEVNSQRVATLRRARSYVLPGNGKQRGRHTSIDRVLIVA